MIDTAKETNMVESLRAVLNPYQENFYYSTARFPAMVSAWGTGKTMTALMRAVSLSEQIPNNLGLVIRKDFTDLRDSTIFDFEQYTGYKVNSKRECDLPNGSRIMFRHGKEFSTLQNINLGWFMIEQGEEFETAEQFDLLRGRLRKNVAYRTGFLIANTKGRNWIWKRWKKQQLEGYELSEAKTADNAHNLPKDFMEDLLRMKLESPNNFKRFVENSWDDSDLYDVLLQYTDLQKCFNLHLNRTETKINTSYDPARFGDDRSIAYAFENERAVEKLSCRKFDTQEVAMQIHILNNKYQPSRCSGDTIGLGGGVHDRLRALKGKRDPWRLVEINVGADEHDAKYFNFRTELAFYARDKILACECSIDPEDEDLIADLTADRYTIMGDKILKLLPKAETKKLRGGVSPDSGDAWKIGLYENQFAQTVKQMRKRENPLDGFKRKRTAPNSFMTA